MLGLLREGYGGRLATQPAPIELNQSQVTGGRGNGGLVGGLHPQMGLGG